VSQRTITVITSSRADYGHLYWPLVELQNHPDIELRLVAIGPHLSPEFGRTVTVIEGDGFLLDAKIECLLSSDSDVAMAKTIGIATMGLADYLGDNRPDLLLVIADRYEMLAPAAVALALRIPLVHIEGGEASEGAIDHAVRNALTMMSHVHLTPTELSRERVLIMGENPARVHCVGAPSLDHLRRTPLWSREETSRELDLTFGDPMILVGYHPETLAEDTLAGADEVFAALEILAASRQIVFCFPNADAGSRALIERSRSFCGAHPKASLHVNLDPKRYWSLLRQVDLLLGNSSSGIMETPSLRIPAVNIGDRQQGRERAANIIDVESERTKIVAAVERGLRPEFRASLEGLSNPYGDGRASQEIVEILAQIELGPDLLRKKAVDPNAVTPRLSQ